MYEHHSTPSGWVVWLGAYNGLHPAFYETIPIRPKMIEGGEPDDSHGTIFSMLLGCVLLKVAAMYHVPAQFNPLMAHRIFSSLYSSLTWPPLYPLRRSTTLGSERHRLL